ncbi:hypothetical protein J3R30DRAFT_3709559 [Lentinula aciculospora]|uniref:Uncharacterized protein n=1 Tax=Lentinula aciculospora TaxID=153920 RepID=A0A9W9DIH6_9AGAR|nr:hypothetical protein J3R30DRAFT_3709559 [Lentinula aciculospora]
MITSAKTSNQRCRCRFRETDPRWRPCPAHGRSDWPILTIGEPHTHIDDRRRVVRGGLVHYALMDKNLKNDYYAQRTGSHPTQQSLSPNPDTVLSCWETSPEFSFKPNGIPETGVNISQEHEARSAPHRIHDPRDPIVEKTSQRTTKGDSNQGTKKPSPGLIATPSWTGKPLKSLVMVLDSLLKLMKNKSK